jgi:hypothetical protein
MLLACNADTVRFAGTLAQPACRLSLAAFSNLAQVVPGCAHISGTQSRTVCCTRADHCHFLFQMPEIALSKVLQQFSAACSISPSFANWSRTWPRAPPHPGGGSRVCSVVLLGRLTLLDACKSSKGVQLQAAVTLRLFWVLRNLQTGVTNVTHG